MWLNTKQAAAHAVVNIKTLRNWTREAREKFENSPAAGLVVVVVWCGMLVGLMWVATA